MSGRASETETQSGGVIPGPTGTLPSAVVDPMDSVAPDGIDVSRVTEWMVANVEGVTAPLRFELVAGGRSNLTFAVTDAAQRRMVLRRPPISHVLSTAHDMGREHRIIAALRDSPVPVPEALGFCADEAVNHRPFYVMGFVDGYILREGREAQRILSEDLRRVAGDDLLDVLVAIHQVDVDSVGLGDLGRPDAYIERQLKRWYGQFKQSQAQEEESGFGHPAGIVDEVYETLVARVPQQVESSIVHGDYRLDNTMIGDDGRVKAVLDWELCTLGEPLADLGTLQVYWADHQDNRTTGMVAATSLPGFPTRDELAKRYASESGRDISNLPYYVAFAHWRLACIIEGVYARYATGAMGGKLTSTAGMGQTVVLRAELARQALTQL